MKIFILITYNNIQHEFFLNSQDLALKNFNKRTIVKFKSQQIKIFTSIKYFDICFSTISSGSTGMFTNNSP